MQIIDYCFPLRVHLRVTISGRRFILPLYTYCWNQKMSSEEQGEIIQYVPFMSFVHPSFWHTLTDNKIDLARLDDSTKEVYGRYTYREDIKTVLEVDGTSFNTEPQEEPFYINIVGTILNKNTVENFKSLDKALFLNCVGDVIWNNVRRKTWIESPDRLLTFVILSFADLKKFNYYYWFTFPCPTQPTVYLSEKPSLAKLSFSDKQLSDILGGFKVLPSNHKCFFLITPEEETVIVDPLNKYIHKHEAEMTIDISKSYFAFADPSNGDNPGWPLRMLIAALLEKYPEILPGAVLKVFALRCSPNGSINNSLVYSIKVPEDVECTESADWIGWERNDKGKFGPRLASMSASMDPVKLADTSSELNIKLMKWRLVPDLDVELMKNTRCLLLGAGTLGCHVARNLLAWGFRHITFLDSGKVSYSNPTRQVLYNYEDCLAGGRMKAQAAAENLKKILPTVKSTAIVEHIPMPGHPTGEGLREEALASYRALSAAIADHDVVFLLLDTREARWLPTLLAANENKIVINAALGFDSYLVLRHGVGLAAEDTGAGAAGYVPGGQLGCYFCNDVTAPGNSLKERTLDQQCTVSRPGAAAIAGALSVELLVSVLQHPLRAEAPAIYNIPEDAEKDPEITQGLLGVVPHSIRGFLHSFQTVTPTCTKFKQCIACSDVVINAYKEKGVDFVLKVLDSASYLEEVTGLKELHLAAEMSDMLTLSDDDETVE